MRQWMPSKKEWVIEVGLLVAVTALQSVFSIIERWPPPIIILLALTTLLLAAGLVATYEYFRRPSRRRVLQGKELMDTIDAWLRDRGYVRGYVPTEMLDYAMVVTSANCTLWVGIEKQSKSLKLGTGRVETNIESLFLDRLDNFEWAKMQYDLQLELSRVGVDYQIKPRPLSVTFWAELPVDETFSESAVLKEVGNIQRVDRLVQLIVGRAAIPITLSQQATPNMGDTQQRPTDRLYPKSEG
jgi:hypothetical protein